MNGHEKKHKGKVYFFLNFLWAGLLGRAATEIIARKRWREWFHDGTEVATERVSLI